jgi:antitoxin YefM
MSLEDYNSIEETLYVINNPKNAERLFQSINDYENGKLFEKKIIE